MLFQCCSSILAFKSINRYWVVQSINLPHTVRNRTATLSFIGSANQSVRHVTRTSPSLQDQPFAFTIRYLQFKQFPQFSMLWLLSQILARASSATCKSIRYLLFVNRYSLCKLSSQLFISYSVIFNLWKDENQYKTGWSY